MTPTQPVSHPISAVGILGGGQLALMLAEAGRKMGMRVSVFGHHPDDPALKISDQPYAGTLESPVLSDFLRSAPIVTFENEFIDCDRMATTHSRLGEAAPRLCPSLASIRALQDKLKQKELLTRLEIPTSSFMAFNPGETLPAFVGRAFERFKGAAVFKWARMGYDGKGVLIGGSPSEAESFCKNGAKTGHGIYAEARVSFRRELALVAAHSTTGEFASYPLVISEQKNGICHRVHGPALKFGVNPDLEEQARDIALRLTKQSGTYPGIHGVFAIEFFEDENGKLLVNEIAPRVHNSGHYTQDACRTSQFENHLRAVLGMPLGDTSLTHPVFAMLNLLGPDPLNETAGTTPLGITPLPLAKPGIYVHWYGKKELRPARKLGHLNGVADDELKLPALFEALDQCADDWSRRIAHARST